MYIEAIVMDQNIVPFPVKQKPKAKPEGSRYNLFFRKLKINQSFTCPNQAGLAVRSAFIYYKRMAKPNFKLVSRSTSDGKRMRFWAVPNDKS